MERTLPHGHVAAALGLFGKLGMVPPAGAQAERGTLAGGGVDRLAFARSGVEISALQNAGVRQLARSGAVRMELFDKRDLAEIRCGEDFPGERLVVCVNPALREEQARKRTELLEVTEGKLRKISDACARARNPYRGKDRIARRVEREAGKYKMLKHFKLGFGETGLDFERDESSLR